MSSIRKILEVLGNLKKTENVGPDFLSLSRTLLVAILIIQLITASAIVFDIFIARQVLGFLFLTIVPGILILKLFKVKTASLHSTILLSVGISVLFLMLVGLTLNITLPIFGITKTLTPLTIISTINAFVIITIVFLWTKCEPSHHVSSLNFRNIPLIIALSFIPIVTLLGVQITLATNDSLPLMLLIVLTTILVLCAFSKRLIPSNYYPLLVLVIASFLLFHISLISGYLIGYDVHMEAYYSQLTFINSHWNANLARADPYNAMMSITILPVIYANFLNFDLTWVLKVIFPLIYLFVPLTLYFVYRKQTNSLIALLGAFLFMSIDTFYVQMLGLTRQMIGELFFVLAIFLIVEKRIGLLTRKILLVVFGIGIVMSHYSIAYLFFFLIIVARLVDAPGTKNKYQKAITIEKARTYLPVKS